MQNAQGVIYHHRVVVIDTNTTELLAVSPPFRLPHPLLSEVRRTFTSGTLQTDKRLR
jgi:non-canonical (house-cleaning) NTP pyrophosphatase